MSFRWRWHTIFLALLYLLPADAQKDKLKPTELVIARYQRLILRGSLLTPKGWKRVSQFLSDPQPYPSNSEILVEWTGTTVLGEEWNDGHRAQVSTKWNDFYGTIDAKLRFKHQSSVLPMAGTFTLIYVPRSNAKGASEPSPANDGEWKIENPLTVRIADVPVAIRYLELMRDQTNDSNLRKNAETSIDTLKHYRSGCAIPNPC